MIKVLIYSLLFAVGQCCELQHQLEGRLVHEV